MIRIATLNDKAQILEIYEEAKLFIKSYNSPQWQDGYPNEDSFYNDLNNKRLYVYEINNEIAGVASFYHYESDYDLIYEGKWLSTQNNYIAVHTIATAEKYRGKKIAPKFFDFIFNNFKVNSIRIDTHELNIPMIKMLTKSQFEYCGIIYLKKANDNKRLAYERIKK